MAIVNVNGISGINSITAQSGSLNFYTAAGNNLPISAGALNVGTGASISSPATNVLALGTNDTERVRIDSSGLVGIGSDSPAAPLNVVNNNANTPTVWLRNISGGGDSPVLRVQGGANNNNTVGTFEVRDYDGNVDFKVGGTGKIGINNTNPLSTLSVGTRTSDVSDTSLIFTAGGSSSGGEVLAATFCNTAAGASNNATAISFTCRSGDSQTAKIVAMQPSGASSPNTQLDFYVYGSSGSTKIVTFDQNGRVTAPYQPAFKIGVNSRTATGSNRILSTDAGDTFLTDRDYFNTGNHFNGSNGRFTAPVTGTYMFIFSFMRANASGSEIDVRIQKNSTGISANMYARAYASAYTSNYQQSIIVTTTKLNVNDWVNVSITGSTSVYNDDTYFAGHLMY